MGATHTHKSRPLDIKQKNTCFVTFLWTNQVATHRKSRRSLYSLLAVTAIDHMKVCTWPNDFIDVALHPYSLVSSSLRSYARILKRLSRVSAVCTRHDENSSTLRHSLLKGLAWAKTSFPGSLNRVKEITFMSGSRTPPQHSTSCMLGIPLYSRALIPAKHGDNYRYQTKQTDSACLPIFMNVIFKNLVTVFSYYFTPQSAAL